MDQIKLYLRTKVNVTGSPEKTKAEEGCLRRQSECTCAVSPQIVDFWSKAKFVVAVVWKQRDKVVAGRIL